MEPLPKHYLSIADWPRQAIEGLLTRARELKRQRRAGMLLTPLAGRSVLLYFEKPSLRTYVTFGVGVAELGGTPVYLPPGQVRLGEREALEDVARNLSRWCDAVVARTYSHDVVVGLAAHGSVPVINALTDHLHPCQALADAMTIAEVGDLGSDRLVFIGDGNNVVHSLIHLAGLIGMRLTVCTPESHSPKEAVMARGLELAARSGADIRIERDPRAAVKDAAFVYTDVWTSMGQESEAEERLEIFRPYQVNAELLSAAPPDVRILHCLPAHRGEEITAEVLESPRSVVFDQAENRLHAQKAVLEALLRTDPR